MREDAAAFGIEPSTGPASEPVSLSSCALRHRRSTSQLPGKGADSTMTEEIRNILLGLGVMAVLLIASCELRATDSEYLKQILRLQFSEFCAHVGKPSQLLAEAINGAIAANPTDPKWRREAEWFNRIVEKYNTAKCGDA